MNISLDAKALDLRFVAMSDGVLPVKKEFGSDAQKLDSAGRPLFSGASLQCVRVVDGRPNGVDNSVSLSVRQPVEVQFGQMYELVGSVTVIHYVASGGRLAVSIQCDGLSSVSNGAPKLNLPKGDQ